MTQTAHHSIDYAQARGGTPLELQLAMSPEILIRQAVEDHLEVVRQLIEQRELIVLRELRQVLFLPLQFREQHISYHSDLPVMAAHGRRKAVLTREYPPTRKTGGTREEASG